MSRKVGRNQPCPCGSKKKYKHCCWDADTQSNTKKRNIVALAGLLALGLVALFMFLSDDTSPPGSLPGPPGPAPLGKIWSPEHGHWHDAPGIGQSVIPDGPSPTLLTPQPSGPAPAGKVWSSEHGHWHDVSESDSLPDSLRGGL